MFFLTAKNSGKQAALHALARLNTGSMAPPRVIELVSRESACVHPGSECHGESCSLARGFYDRLAAARAAAMATPLLDRERVQSLGREHGLCPYYLGQELVKWADVVVADYNHWFDETAALHAMTVANDWRVVVLVDEAHNLVERGRSMYTSELTRSELQAALRAAPGEVRPALKALDRVWKTLIDAQADDYEVHEAVPARFKDRLDKSITAIGDLQTEIPTAIGPELLQLFFALTAFARLAESFGEHSIFDASVVRTDRRRPDHRFCVRNVLPGHFLAPRIAAARSVTLFSATLAPTSFYRSMLSLPESAVDIEVESPFTANQLRVRIASHISTRYADRARSIAPITELIASAYAEAPGNYIAFFSSFDYMERVVADIAKHPIEIWQQQRRMSQADEKTFLDRFVADGNGIGFAVLGGRFSEGIDLPGSRLIGAFIATLGLPQVNEVNEQMRQ
ncbi:MAG: helicase C-terminal domain-containing protein, partial [Caldimonas sp.]